MRQQYHRTEKKLFRTTIVWGDFPEDEGPTTGFNQVEEYVFKTENELEIFLSGVDLACGWSEYMPVEGVFNRTNDTSFGEILEFAEGLGWTDPDFDKDGDWTPEMADATEESALDFIKSKGYVIFHEED